MLRWTFPSLLVLICAAAPAQKSSIEAYAKLARPEALGTQSSLKPSYSWEGIRIVRSKAWLSGSHIFATLQLSDKSTLDLSFAVPKDFDQEASFFQPPQYQLTEFEKWGSPPTFSMKYAHCTDGRKFENYYSIVGSKGGSGNASLHLNGDLLIISGDMTLFRMWDPKAGRLTVSVVRIAVPFETPKRAERWERLWQADLDAAQRREQQEENRKAREEQQRYERAERLRQEEADRKAKAAEADRKAKSAEADRQKGNGQKGGSTPSVASGISAKTTTAGGTRSSAAPISHEQALQEADNAAWNAYRQRIQLEFQRMEQIKQQISEAAKFYEDTRTKAVERANREYEAAEARWEKIVNECVYDDLKDILHDAYMTDLDIILNRRDFVVLGARIVATQNLAKTVGPAEKQRLDRLIQSDMADLRRLAKELDVLEVKLEQLKARINKYKPRPATQPASRPPSSTGGQGIAAPLATQEPWSFPPFKNRPDGTRVPHYWYEDKTPFDPGLPYITMARAISTLRFFVLDCESQPSERVLESSRGPWESTSPTYKRASFLNGTAYEGWTSVQWEALPTFDKLAIHYHNFVSQGHSAQDIAKRIAHFVALEYGSSVTKVGEEYQIEMFSPGDRSRLRNRYLYTIEPKSHNGSDTVYIAVYCEKKR